MAILIQPWLELPINRSISFTSTVYSVLTASPSSNKYFLRSKKHQFLVSALAQNLYVSVSHKPQQAQVELVKQCRRDDVDKQTETIVFFSKLITGRCVKQSQK